MLAGNASEQTRAATKAPLPGAAFEKQSESRVHRDSDEVGYTPSGLQKKAKGANRNEPSTRGSYTFSKDTTTPGKEPIENVDPRTKSSDDVLKSRPMGRPVVASHFSPARHRSHEDMADVRNSWRNSSVHKPVCKLFWNFRLHCFLRLEISSKRERIEFDSSKRAKQTRSNEEPAEQRRNFQQWLFRFFYQPQNKQELGQVRQHVFRDVAVIEFCVRRFSDLRQKSILFGFLVVYAFWQVFVCRISSSLLFFKGHWS